MRRRSPRVTEQMAAWIKWLLNHGWFQHHIAGMFGINQGRVSEIKTGKRFAHVAPMPPES